MSMTTLRCPSCGQSLRVPTLRDLVALELTFQGAEELGPPEPGGDNMLKISSDARKASLDLRMLGINVKEPADSKINNAVRNIVRIHQQEAADKGTQLVFLDWGTPVTKTAKEVEAEDSGEDDVGEGGVDSGALRNLYGAIREKLIAQGVPEEDIAFIHEADDTNPEQAKEKRKNLIAAVNNGAIRVLIGSTDKARVGLNVQQRAAALHHIDAPWRPRDVEQREGRIIRQQNKVYGPEVNEDGDVVSPGRGVKVYQYVQEGSFDRFMWQAIAKKARDIHRLLKRERSEDNEDIDAMDEFTVSASEAMAVASGDMRALRLAHLDQVVQQMEIERAGFRRTQDVARGRSAELSRASERMQALLPALERDAARVQNMPAGEKFAAVIRQQTFDKRDEAGERLEGAFKGMPLDDDAVQLGELQGFTLVGRHGIQGYQVGIQHPATGQEYMGQWVERGDLTRSGMLTRAQNLIKGLPDRLASVQQKLAENRQAGAGFEQQLGGRWDRDPELEHARISRDVVRYLMSRDEKLGARLVAEGIDPETYDYDSDAPPASGAMPTRDDSATPPMGAVTLADAAAAHDTGSADAVREAEDDPDEETPPTHIPGDRPREAALDADVERTGQFADLSNAHLITRREIVHGVVSREGMDEEVRARAERDLAALDAEFERRDMTPFPHPAMATPPRAVTEAEGVAHDAEDFQDALDRYEGADAALELIGGGDREQGRERVHEGYKRELAAIRGDDDDDADYIEVSSPATPPQPPPRPPTQEPDSAPVIEPDFAPIIEAEADSDRGKGEAQRRAEADRAAIVDDALEHGDERRDQAAEDFREKIAAMPDEEIANAIHGLSVALDTHAGNVHTEAAVRESLDVYRMEQERRAVAAAQVGNDDGYEEEFVPATSADVDELLQPAREASVAAPSPISQEMAAVAVDVPPVDPMPAPDPEPAPPSTRERAPKAPRKPRTPPAAVEPAALLDVGAVAAGPMRDTTPKRAPVDDGDVEELRARLTGRDKRILESVLADQAKGEASAADVKEIAAMLAKRNPVKGAAPPAAQRTSDFVPPPLQRRAIAKLQDEELRLLSKYQFSGDEKARLRHLFAEERKAVKEGSAHTHLAEERDAVVGTGRAATPIPKPAKATRVAKPKLAAPPRGLPTVHLRVGS